MFRQEYLQTLQAFALAPNASLVDISRRYRILAKQIHPDCNDSVWANEDFHRLHKNYLYLQKNHDEFQRSFSSAATTEREPFEFSFRNVREDPVSYTFYKRKPFSRFFLFGSTLAVCTFLFALHLGSSSPSEMNFNLRWDHFLKREAVGARKNKESVNFPVKPTVTLKRNAKIEKYLFSRIDAHWGFFYHCLDSQQQTKLQSGLVSFRLTVENQKLSSLESLDGVLQNPRASQCLRNMLSSLTFPELQGKYSLELPIEIVTFQTSASTAIRNQRRL